MKALIYRSFGTPDELKWVDDWPDPEPGDNTVLVRTVAGSVNPKDILLRKGMFSRTMARDSLPRASGLDASGHVVAVGGGVTGFDVGDAVFGMTNRFSGGVHVEIAAFEAGELHAAPASIPLEQAAAVPLAAQTALQAIRDLSGLREGGKILINGASGGVGHFAVQIARALGGEVHAVCSSRNAAFVTGLGADAVYDYQIQPATKINETFDVVFDVFGKASKSAFKRQLGRDGVYVSTVPKAVTIGGELLATMGLTKRSRLVFVKSRADDLAQIAEWIDNGKLNPHIERFFPVEAAADAHRHVETKHTVGKVCLRFPGGTEESLGLLEDDAVDFGDDHS